MKCRFLIAVGFFLVFQSGFAQSIGVKLPAIAADSLGYKPKFLEQIGKKASTEIPSLGAFLVWRKGNLISEQYYHGATDTTAFNVQSVTKSIVGAIAGIANDKGLLPDLDKPIIQILPEYSSPTPNLPNLWFKTRQLSNDSIVAGLTLRHLLTMQSGFLWQDSGPLAQAFTASSDPVRFVLELPFEDMPGQQFSYNTGGSHLFGVALAKSINMPLHLFADSFLFKPLGIAIRSWDVDPQGRDLGGSSINMTATDMMRFGIMYLNNGKFNDNRIISSSWIEASTAEKVILNEWDVLPNANGYGYYFWRRITNGHQAYIASGYGGQIICIIPDLEMTIVTTCFLNSENRGRSEIKRVHLMIDKIVKASR